MTCPSNVDRPSEAKDFIRRAKCPTCKRDCVMHPQRDGYGQPMTDRPYRFPPHAGKRWGRQCPNAGELQT